MAKIAKEDKGKHMAEIGVNYAVIEAARKQVHALEVQAAPDIKRVVESFGPGPHKMPVPTGEIGPDGVTPKTQDLIVTFRKAGDVWGINAIPADDIT